MDQEDKMVVPPKKEPEVEKKQKQEQKALNEKEMDTEVDIRSLVRKTHKGDALQLSVSYVISVIGILKSGEKTTAKEGPMLLEIKGRVRLDAFEKFVRELPNSRSRAFMCFVCKEACSKTQQETISEVVDSYSKDERVSFAEPVSVVELYLYPTRGRTTEI
ncbi:unnamed protein product [Brassica oleracea var. botrytis]|uniref:Spen paralogue and orthologue SPOC C-terminal domain-containing protein n=1 Tax=Brassica oleracea TaxID=3712 RepID=A0A3P6DAR6_BRAOL|nr:unnamed protein product [Brassica oleracea]